MTSVTKFVYIFISKFNAIIIFLFFYCLTNEKKIEKILTNEKLQHAARLQAVYSRLSVVWQSTAGCHTIASCHTTAGCHTTGSLQAVYSRLRQ